MVLTLQGSATHSLDETHCVFSHRWVSIKKKKKRKRYCGEFSLIPQRKGSLPFFLTLCLWAWNTAYCISDKYLKVSVRLVVECIKKVKGRAGCFPLRRPGGKEPEADTPYRVSWSIQGNLGKCGSSAVRGQELGRTDLHRRKGRK